jgi:GntR family transcriptional regulator
VTIDQDSGMPVYAQLAAILRAMIESGEIPPDRPLPSVKSLVQRYGIAQGTAEKAVRVLRDEGIVRTIRGKGIYTLPEG